MCDRRIADLYGMNRFAAIAIAICVFYWTATEYERDRAATQDAVESALISHAKTEREIARQAAIRVANFQADAGRKRILVAIREAANRGQAAYERRDPVAFTEAAIEVATLKLKIETDPSERAKLNAILGQHD